MKITITNYDKTYSAEYDNDSDVESVADMFKGLLVSMGYHPSNVDELFNTEYKWFTQEERDENKVSQKVGTKQNTKTKFKNFKTKFKNFKTISIIKKTICSNKNE